jgi:hypothetical protein
MFGTTEEEYLLDGDWEGLNQAIEERLVRVTSLDLSCRMLQVAFCRREAAAERKLAEPLKDIEISFTEEKYACLETLTGIRQSSGKILTVEQFLKESAGIDLNGGTVLDLCDWFNYKTVVKNVKGYQPDMVRRIILKSIGEQLKKLRQSRLDYRTKQTRQKKRKAEEEQRNADCGSNQKRRRPDEPLTPADVPEEVKSRADEVDCTELEDIIEAFLNEMHQESGPAKA